jgi:hypothetical protein
MSDSTSEKPQQGRKPHSLNSAEFFKFDVSAFSPEQVSEFHLLRQKFYLENGGIDKFLKRTITIADVDNVFSSAVAPPLEISKGTIPTASQSV